MKINIEIEELRIQEIDELVNLFCLTWGLNFEEVKERTLWAFFKTKSLVLVAKYDSKIVGARGSFSWPLVYNDIKINAYQFHNTCVHPDYRRMGIFTKLNLSFIEYSGNSDNIAIFNVSVKNSKLGYEKLGWQYLPGFRRLTFFSQSINVLRYQKDLKLEPKIDQLLKDYNTSLQDIDKKLLHTREEVFTNIIHTDLTYEFLNWRLLNKKGGYRIFSVEEGSIIYKILLKGRIKELIIGEVFLRSYKCNTFKKLINELVKKEQPAIIYTYLHVNHPLYKFYISNFFLTNPIHFNLYFGTRLLANDIKLSALFYAPQNWGLSYLDIDTF